MKEMLAKAADNLAEEIHRGKWDHIADLAVKPAGACAEIVQGLERRCPGYEFSDYRKAIGHVLFESR
jgi:hypothetical protein